MKITTLFSLLLGTALVFAAACFRAPAPVALAPAATAVSNTLGDTAKAQRDTARGPRPYAEVIISKAVTQRGLFTTHRIGEKLYFELPRDVFGRDFLILTRIVAGSRTQFSGDRQIARWERVNNRIYLTERRFDSRADTTLPIYRAVAANTLSPLIAHFDIESFGPDSAVVVDATPIFATKSPVFSLVKGIVAERSYIEDVAAFPENVNVTAVQTGTAPQRAGDVPAPGTVRAQWSFLRLPAKPMMPRLADSRVGYLSLSFTDYSDGPHRAERRTYIHRFRLERQDPDAHVSEPIKPIVFWIDPATPQWLVPWVERGVLEWRRAFEEAGFRNAILPRRAPTPQEDPHWSMQDARYSVIYWNASTTENAFGGQVVDPRSGEILKAEVNMHHNIMNLVRNWYFVQVGPLDPRARTLPLPDSLMGRLVQFVVAHEVGHAIGLPHNMRASSTFPADSVRSAAFLRRMGSHTPSIMDYSRFNYVAQPEDSIPVDLLVPVVGPYDRFAVVWGHKPIPGAATPDDERPTLNRWARAQDSVPWLRYEIPGGDNDPGVIFEAVGDADAVTSNALGLRNLERVMGMLLDAAERPGEDYDLLRELYRESVNQWGRYMGHVAAVVGGADSRERRGTGVRFTPVSRERQRRAVGFLVRNAFWPPAYFLDSAILRRIEPAGAVSRIGDAQASVLGTLLAGDRLGYLVEYEAFATRAGAAYTVADLVADLRRGIWGELRQAPVFIGLFRRTLQRAHLDAIDGVLNPSARGAVDDARPVLRGELVELDRAIRATVPRASDVATRLHLLDLRTRIARILDPPAASAAVRRGPPTVPIGADAWWCAFDDGAVESGRRR